jgi:hypothetical protein
LKSDRLSLLGDGRASSSKEEDDGKRV